MQYAGPNLAASCPWHYIGCGEVVLGGHLGWQAGGHLGSQGKHAAMRLLLVVRLRRPLRLHQGRSVCGQGVNRGVVKHQRARKVQPKRPVQYRAPTLVN